MPEDDGDPAGQAVEPKKKKGTWGGRRKGSGGKLRNRNALRTGKYSEDADLKNWLSTLSPGQLKMGIKHIKAGRSDPAELAALERSIAEAAGAQFHQEPLSKDLNKPSIHTTHTEANDQVQEGSGRLKTVVQQMESMYWFGAAGFVRLHWPRVDVLEELLDDFKQAQELAPEQMQALSNPVGLLRDSYHEAIAVRIGDMLGCPYRKWRQGTFPLDPQDADDRHQATS